ncbi:hypothetical protein D3C81_2323650 [compost metagenome]
MNLHLPFDIIEQRAEGIGKDKIDQGGGQIGFPDPQILAFHRVAPVHDFRCGYQRKQ